MGEEGEDGDGEDFGGGDDVPGVERNDPSSEEIEFAEAVGAVSGTVSTDGIAALILGSGAFDLDAPQLALHACALAAATYGLGVGHLDDEVVGCHAPDGLGDNEAALEALPEEGTLRLIPKMFGVPWLGHWRVGLETSD